VIFSIWYFIFNILDFIKAKDQGADISPILCGTFFVAMVLLSRSQHHSISVLLNLSNDVYLEGFRDRVNIFEDITGNMLGCDRKNIEKEFGGPIVGVSLNDPSLIVAKSGVQLDDSVQSDDTDDVATRFNCDEAGWTTVASNKVKRARRFRK
jgi:hypothetical protein